MIDKTACEAKAAPDEYDDEGFEFTDWQSFDWSGLGSMVRGIDRRG